MNQTAPGHRPSILRARQQQNDKQQKRASFSDDVLYSEQRRASGVSLAVSEGTTDDSNKSNDTVEYMLRTSTHSINQSKVKKRISDSAVSKGSSSNSSFNAMQCNPTCNCLKCSDKQIKIMKNILNHKAWKISIFYLTLILLFGPTVKNFFPKGADIYFDIILTITLVVLLADMLMMCYTVPMYFVFNPSWKLRSNDNNEIGCLCFAFQVGSFLFWFDFISVITLLYDISFVNRSLNKKHLVELYTDVNGICDNLARFHSLNFDFSLFLTVVSKVPRVVRLLRVDNVNALQSILAGMNIAICSHEGRGYYNRRFFWFRRNDFGSEEKLKEMQQAACKIQRAWRSQSFVGAFVSAGARHRAKLLPPQQQPKLSFRGPHAESQKHAQNDRMTRNRNRLSNLLHKQDNENRSRIKNLLQKQESIEVSLSSSVKREKRKRKKSQIGIAMNDITMRRVSEAMMIAILVTIVFTYLEVNESPGITMVSLHNTMTELHKQNITEKYGYAILDNARSSSAKHLCEYSFKDQNKTQNKTLLSRDFGSPPYTKDNKDFCENRAKVREWSQFNLTVCSMGQDEVEICNGLVSSGIFVFEKWAMNLAIIKVIVLITLLILVTVGLMSFVGPVTTLVVSPIERMIRLLSMLVKDPLGYSKTKKYRTFIKEDNEVAKNTTWTQKSLNGMETSFLMSTILRIGSLMKVGFGAAGVEIIRSNMRKSSRASIILSESKRFGCTVACIFMFCDIRGFTDSSECLNEEVFVFTNRIAAVVHSYIHAYGGSANKNEGDAFLCSWKLDPPPAQCENEIYAKRKQADKALLSVVKICIALYHESFFLEGLSDASILALKKKFEKREGNLVQLGFGLHAGKAVEGAIGSPRKLDATYLSEAVELSEYLETSTKKYGVNVLMSGKFYSLLQKSVQVKCRKIDHIFFTEDYQEDDPSELDEIGNGYHMSLHTYDMDINALFDNDTNFTASERERQLSGISIDNSGKTRQGSLRRTDDGRVAGSTRSSGSFLRRRMSIFGANMDLTGVRNEEEQLLSNERLSENESKRKLEIPETTLIYNSSVWLFEDIRIIRRRFNRLFFEKFKAGYKAYINGEWKKAQDDFEFMVEEFDDKPSQYFLDKMKECNYITPRNFTWRLHAVALEYH